MNMAGYSIPSGRGAWSVSSEEFSRHFTYYLHLVPSGSLLSGELAREFFLQTNVPPLHLAHIWKLSDLDCDGRLDGAEFCIAMCLIHHWMSGAHLPTSLPPPLVAFYHQVKWPRLPPAGEEHVLKCKKVFEVFQKNIKSGKMIGKAAKYLLNKSNLPVEQLHHIWSLADKDCDGKLTFSEFTVAMHLVFLAKVGFLLPVSLEPSSILPSEFSKLAENSNAEDHSDYIVDEATPTNTPAPSPLGVPIDNRNNPFMTEAFVDLPTSHYQDKQYDSSPGNPFLLVADSASVSDGERELVEREISADQKEDSGELVEEDSSDEEEDSTGRYLYPGCQETIELPSQLSVIPEEKFEEEEEGEEGAVADGQGNSSTWYHVASQQTEGSQGEETGDAVPWYREYSTSQDAWQTTPAYRSEEVWPVAEETKMHTHFLSPQGTMMKAMVTEETIPELQVAMAVEVKSKSPLARKQEEEDEEEEEEGLTAEDLADLEKITQDSNKFLLEHGGSTGSSPCPQANLLFSQDIQDASRRGLQATINGMETSLPASSPPASSSVIPSNTPRKTTSSLSNQTDQLGRIDGLLSEEDEGTEADLLEGLEAEMKNISELADDIDQGTPELPALSDQGEAHQSQRTQTHVGTRMESISSLYRNQTSYSPVVLSHTNPNAVIGGLSSLQPVQSLVPPPPRPPLPKSPPPRPPLPVSPQPSPLPTPESPSPSEVIASSSILPEVRPHPQAEKSHPFTTRSHPPSGLTPRSLDFGSLQHPSPLEPRPSLPSPQTPEGGCEVMKDAAAIRGTGSRRRNKFSRSSVNSMDDLDSLFEGEMASINEVFQEFEIKDKQNKKRWELEQEDLKRVEPKTIPALDTAPKVSLEEISKRRSQEAAAIEKQWKEEMEALERESRQVQQPTIDDDTDIVLQDLDNELQLLIKSKEEDVKLTQREKELYAQRQKEEKERKEKERLERLAQQKDVEVQEMTIDEWIAWMEEKKKKGMTPEQIEEYERRKAIRQKMEKEREEKRKREEEEKKRKTREKIESEIRSYRVRSQEMSDFKLSDETIRQNFEEMARKNEEESRLRREKGVRMREEMKQQEIEDLKPKARSALAARWEESVKAKGTGTREEHRATVVTRAKTNDGESLEREEERLIRRISGHFPNGSVKLSPEKKRHSSTNS